MIKKFLKLFGIFLVFILLAKFIYSQGWYAVTITNTQSTATPAPFQQDIAICNGNPSIGNNFAYINNPTLFNEINSNGSNVYFTTNLSGNPNIYSWYEGQLNYNGVTCDVWWVNLSNGIPANSNVTIHMYIGNSSDNYYQQYYPYVGTNAQVIGTMQYDNGNYTFIAYGYFNNTADGWFGDFYISNNYYSITITSNGIEMLAGNTNSGTFMYPPNDGKIPLIPLIVEEAWYSSSGADANVIALFGIGQINAASIGNTDGGTTQTSNSSTFVQFEYYNGVTYLKSAVTNRVLNSTSFPTSRGTFYSYLIVNSSYAQTGYYIYSSNQVWVPLTLLNTYNINNNGYTYSNLNYNPYRYNTLEISAGDSGVTSYQYVEWVVARAYPPNGVMPSFSIIPLTPLISVNTSTNFQFNVSIYDLFSEYVNYTVYLNGTPLVTNNVLVTAGQTLTIPYTYQYLFNQSGTYNLTVVAYGQSSGITAIATNIFSIQLDQLNVSLQPYYTYNNANYTNLYNSNLNINDYCMRPHNALIIYDNITNQTLQFNLSCNYIETPENLFVNLTPILQNNTLNYINGSLTYGTQSFNLSFIPLWDTITVNLNINLPAIYVYTSPLGMNYTVTENDVLPNVVCNTSFYDNNTLIANNQSTLTNSSVSYSWTISQTPIHNFNWSITCKDPVNVTTLFTYLTGPFYYNKFNMYMEDSGNIPSNITYSLALVCINYTIQYSNANMNTYTLYLWTNSTCNQILISQQIQGITFYEGFSTNLLSNYGFQWPICLINTALAYFGNPLIGSQSYQDTLIAVENPQTGCYLEGSYLYLSASNYYYEPAPMRPGALYVIRANNTYLATVEGQQSQAISIDDLIAQVYLQKNNTLTIILTYPIINVTNISANVYQITITAPATVSSANISIFYNNSFYQSYVLNSINSYNFTILLTDLPANYTFNSTNYLSIVIEYENGVVQQLFYPPNILNNEVTLPSFMVYLIAILILYAWTRAFSYYQRLIIAGFGLALFLLLASIAILQTTAPIVLAAGIFFLFILDIAYTEFINSRFMGEHPLLKPLSFLIRMFIVITFVTNVVGLFFGPYGIYNLNLPDLNDYMNHVNDTINNLNNLIHQMTNNPFNFIFDFIGLAINVISAISLAIQGVSVFVSLILTPVTVLLGPSAAAVAQAIVAIAYYGSIIAILVYLALLVFAAVGLKPF